MLNFIAGALVAWMLTPDVFATLSNNIVKTRDIAPSGWFPGWDLGDVNGQIYGFIVISALVGLAYWFVLGRTRFGFDLRATGMSESAAVASGVGVKRMVVSAMLLSGGVAGLVGMPLLLGGTHSFGQDFPAGIGFTGIAIALLGRNNPVGIALGALLWGFLERTTNHLEFQGYDKEILGVIQGVIVLCVVIAYEVVRRYGLKRQQQRVGAELAAQAAAPTEKQEVA
jgi:simple sugar transport system permease protein